MYKTIPDLFPTFNSERLPAFIENFGIPQQTSLKNLKPPVSECPINNQRKSILNSINGVYGDGHIDFHIRN